MRLQRFPSSSQSLGDVRWRLKLSVSLSYLPAVPLTDEQMKLQDVAFPAETVIPLFPSVRLEKGGLRVGKACAGPGAS